MSDAIDSKNNNSKELDSDSSQLSDFDENELENEIIEEEKINSINNYKINNNISSKGIKYLAINLKSFFILHLLIIQKKVRNIILTKFLDKH